MDASETRDALLTLWAAIVTWQDDVACGVLPPPGILQRAREAAEKALERNGTPVGFRPVPMAPLPPGFSFHEREARS